MTPIKFENNWIPQKVYNEILKNMPILCVDNVIYRYSDKLRMNKQILLIKRKDEPLKDVYWLVGGRLKLGEEFKDCAKRIIKEEVGIIISDRNETLNQITVSNTVYPTSPAKCPMQSINVVFGVEVKSKKVTLDSHSSDYKWINQDEIESEYIKQVIRRMEVSCFLSVSYQF